MALAIAGATDTAVSSPKPLAPSGLASSSNSPTNRMSSCGISAFVGTRYPEKLRFRKCPVSGSISDCSRRSLSDAPDDAADGLTARRLRIDDSTGVVGVDKAIQADQAKVRIDTHFSEEC